jgi:ureidoglycolate lyase
MKPEPSLPALPITAAAFAPYGWLVSAEGQAGRAINDGSSLRVDDVGELALTAQGGAPCLTVFRARARDPRGPWHTLERHRLGTQTFVPMAGTRYVVLVALGNDVPDPATLAAFFVRGDQAVTLRAGTWHHGLLALDDGDFVVIERRAAEVDCDVAELPAPVALQLG